MVLLSAILVGGGVLALIAIMNAGFRSCGRALSTAQRTANSYVNPPQPSSWGVTPVGVPSVVMVTVTNATPTATGALLDVEAHNHYGFPVTVGPRDRLTITDASGAVLVDQPADVIFPGGIPPYGSATATVTATAAPSSAARAAGSITGP